MRVRKIELNGNIGLGGWHKIVAREGDVEEEVVNFVP